jgi:hypothetical protein
VKVGHEPASYGLPDSPIHADAMDEHERHAIGLDLDKVNGRVGLDPPVLEVGRTGGTQQIRHSVGAI